MRFNSVYARLCPELSVSEAERTNDNICLFEIIICLKHNFCSQYSLQFGIRKIMMYVDLNLVLSMRFNLVYARLLCILIFVMKNKIN